MYRGFSITTIEPSYADKSITVTTSFDIDSTSVNERTIKVFSKNDRVDVDIDFVVDKKTITILLRTEIVPNTDYILRITNGIANILGETLSSGIRRNIVFSSDIEEIPVIMTPSNYEEVSKLSLSLETANSKSDSDKMYFVQIAKDVAFINTVIEATTDKKKTEFSSLDEGQYYIRARVEQLEGEERKHGKWSEVVTFVSLKKDSNTTEDSGTVIDPNEPEFIQDIHIIDKPENGETPESILIEFSGDIDPDFIDSIVLIRRDI